MAASYLMALLFNLLSLSSGMIVVSAAFSFLAFFFYLAYGFLRAASKEKKKRD